MEWLSIGSIVRLNGGMKKIMITSRTPLAIPGIIGCVGMVTHGGSNLAQGINEIQLGRAKKDVS